MNLFGYEEERPITNKKEKINLRDKFIEPPFTLLDSKTASWRGRMKHFKSLGIKGELGRNLKSKNRMKAIDGKNPSLLSIEGNEKKGNFISVFDPALCEVLYKWFCPDNGTILDPFAGGSVRGIVANYLGYKYSGIEIIKEQVESNREQALGILDLDNQPKWWIGDSNVLLGKYNMVFDMVFTCPPYANLEVYSNLEGDISNMDYDNFLKSYEEIIAKSCNLLKSGGYACFVVGEVRDKKGNYIGFVPDTINAFRKCGMDFYNEAIYLQGLGTAAMRANNNMKNKKLVKVHQNVLVFKKPS
jgi:DNA modification methylase